MPRRWTPDRIIEEILRLVEAEEDITYTGLVETGLAGLYAAAKDKFGSWKVAVDAAGVPLALASRYSHHKNWTDEKVLREIRKRARRGESLAFSDAKAEDGPLVNAGVRRFYSWREAVTQAGEDYEKHLKNWERDSLAGTVFENLIDRVFRAVGWEYERHSRFDYPGHDRVYVIPDFVVGDIWWDAKLRASSPHVEGTIQRYLKLTDQLTIVYLDGTAPEDSPAQFISAEELLDQLEEELDPAFVSRCHERLAELRAGYKSKTQLEDWAVVWTREHVLSSIRDLHESGDSLLAGDVRERHPRLYGAVHRKDQFTHWYDAVSQAGFDGDALADEGRLNRIAKRTLFSKAYCMGRLLELEREGADLSNRGLLDSEPSLAAALFRHWDSTTKALEHIGIDPEVYRRQTKWTKTVITEKLQERLQSGRPMNPGAISAQDSNLYQAAVRHFDSLEDAAAAAGISLPRLVKGAPWFNNEGEFKEEMFREVIAAWAAEGRPLGCAEVLSKNPAIVGAARTYLGGWYNALELFGYDVHEIRVAARAHTKKWSKERIRKQLQDLAAEGVDISHTGLRNNGHLDLLGACEMYFDGWAPALESAGLNPGEHRRKRQGTVWSREVIVSEIQSIHDAEGDLSVTGMLEDHPKLYGSATRTYFDSWSDALRAADIDPESVRRGPPRWTPEVIVAGLKDIGNPDGSIVPTAVKASHPQLYDAVFRRFDSLEDAAAEADLTVARMRRLRRTDEEIIDEIRALAEQGVPLWWNAIRNSHSALTSAAVSRWHFGSWRAAIEAASLDYETILEQGKASRIRSRTKWSKPAILEAIKKRVSESKSLAPTKVAKEDKAMYEAACKPRYFGSWRAAVEAAEFRYEDFVRARRSTKRTRRY